MEKFEFDNTRKNIRIKDLSKDERNTVLGRFKGIGGEILEEHSLKEKKETKAKRIDDKKISETIAKERSKNAKRQAVFDKQTPKPSHQQKFVAQGKNETSDFLSLMQLRTRGRLAGVCDFFGQKVNSNFVTDLAKDLRDHCVNIRLFARELLVKDKEMVQRLLPLLKARQPMFLPLLKRSVNIYQKEEASILVSANSVGSKIYYTNIKEPLIIILRKLYYLRSHRSVYTVGIKYTIDSIERALPKSKNFRKVGEKAEESWINLMTDVYQKLCLVVRRMERNTAKPGSKAFEHLITTGVIASATPKKKES